jgi:hypothetical protein
MPLIKLTFKPGINRDTTNYANEGGWYDGDHIRFLSGFPQKIGGWVRAIPKLMAGVCRQMWNYSTTFGDNLLALGTNSKVYLEAGSNLYDITPLRATFDTPDTDNCFDLNLGSNVVVVNIDAHGASPCDYVEFSGVEGTGGLVGGIPESEFNTSHCIKSVIDENTFTITVVTPATFGDGWGLDTWSLGEWGIGGTGGTTLVGVGGTSIVAKFDIESGNASITYGYGWGTGTWDASIGWGTGSTQPILLPQRDWWFDNFDNDLVANIRNGPVYYWVRGTDANPTTALATRAELLSDIADNEGFDGDDVPSRVMQIVLSQNDKHLIAFGAVPYGSTNPNDFDPLLIRWADQDNPFQWQVSATTSAGFVRVSRGSRIVRALPTRQEILVWTESHLFSLQFLGTTDVFGLQELADNISIISPRSVVTANNITFWMGKEKFYAYSGRVETVPTTVRQYVFEDLDFNQSDQIVAGSNEGWNEVWWCYPSKGSNTNNRYVIFNYSEKIWYFGTIARTAWLDSPLRDFPIAANAPGLATNATCCELQSILYYHENGTDDDGLPLPAYIQSSDQDIGDGEHFMLTRRIIPDIDFSGSAVNTNPEATFQIRPRAFPGVAYQGDPSDSQRVIETTVGQYTEQVFIRARGRQVAMNVSSTGLGVQWQLGSPRLDTRQDGKR